MLHVRSAARSLAAAFLLSPLLCGSSVGAATAVLPDGRGLSPAGFTIPVEGFASALALSPDERWLAVLGAGSGAIDVLSIDDERPGLVTRLVLPSATGLTWTSDGLYVSCGYSGRIARYAYDAAASKAEPALSKRLDVQTGEGGLLGGIAEDPATHRVAVARSADREVLVLDDAAGSLVARLAATGQPFGVAFAGDAVAATLYDGDSVDVWRAGKGDAVRVRTGPHPTALLADGPRLFVSDADGHDVAAVDVTSLAVTARYELGVEPNQPPGQTPAGMALSDDRRTLFVAESGFNDVAVVDLASARVVARIPTGWYPTDLSFVDRPTIDKDPRNKAQLWIASAKGLGSQPDPGGEWDGSYTGIVQHVVVEPNRFRQWSARVASNDRFGPVPPRRALPPIEHVVFIVRENKHFDEVFGDEPRADADPTLLLYGRAFTPNAHALAERFTLFDDFMGNGESSIYGHAWTTQGFANDYQERNARSRDESTPGVSARVAYSIWPDPVAGDDSLPPAEMNDDWYRDLSDLPAGPRVNVSGVFGPRGELIDALARHGVSFRVYGEQMTMLGDGRIAPGLAAHAARRYPGDHIDFGVLDTERARIFLDDVRAHGLARYSYLTLPTDHTAGTKAGFS
ncbi:MAG: YncE family protein, partial [Vulcanimicrobiaceae bacterium]